MDELRDAVIVVDAEGVEVFRNPAGERYRGARHSAAIVEDNVRDQLERARRGEESEREVPLFGPPREVIKVRAVPLEADDRLLGAAAVVVDVTELRRVESIRRDFVANVSHELKTPIGALQLLAETLAETTDPPVQVQLSQQLVHEASRLANIVDDLLDLSMIEAQESPTRERVPVRVILDEAIERVRALAVARGIPMSVAPVDASLVVSCDPVRVVSAVTNLLDNAVKYSEPGAPVEVSAQRAGDSVALIVRDHGIGIPSSDLERVFERFYRVDKARSRSTGGTGLGLSIVRHIAHAHGGEVSVESLEGDGSTFRFELPLLPADVGSHSEIAEAS
jgi:two-component system sensor histidine kinase SenX3